MCVVPPEMMIAHLSEIQLSANDNKKENKTMRYIEAALIFMGAIFLVLTIVVTAALLSTPVGK